MRRKGTYVLFMHFSRSVKARIGALGEISLARGDYCYVGSAMGGLDQRISRHLSKDKAMRWHIDYLTVLSDRTFAYESSGEVIPECELGILLQSIGSTPVAKGFGCSDCDCLTHLFKVKAREAEQVLIVNKLTKFVE